MLARSQPRTRFVVFGHEDASAALGSTVRPVNHNPWVLLHTQDLPPLYMENSNFYVFTADLIKSTRRRIGDRPKMFEIHPLEALDIDDEQSFALAEQLMHVKTHPRS